MWDREKKYTGSLFPRILEGRAQDYYLHFVDQRTDTFLTVYTKLKNHFDTDVNHSHYYADWTTTSFAKVHRENPDKTLHEVLDIMLDKLQLCQRALGQQYMGEYALRTTVITACRGVKEFAMALYRPSLECEVLLEIYDLRLKTLAMTTSVNFTEVDQGNQYYLDRRYNSNGRNRGGSRGGTRGAFQKGEQSFDSSRGFKPRWKKKCFVCQKEGCWSTNHTDEERKTARAQFFSMLYFTGAPPKDFSVHLAEYEGIEHTSQYNQRGWKEEEDCEDDDNDDGTGEQQYFEQQFFKEQCLADQAFLHHISGDDIYGRGAPSAPASQFLLEDRYTRSLYQGILPDTGAANVSTVGKEQYLALTREDPTVKIDTSTAGKASIKFGKGEATASIGTVQVSTEIGKINFEVLEAPTPFLLCLADMDRLKSTSITLQMSLFRTRYASLFYANGDTHGSISTREREQRTLAITTLKRTLEEVTKFCHHCQLHSSAPRRFKFTLKDDHHFNYEILVDVMYLSGKPVLHVVDSSTAFQGAKFLSAISAKETWQALRMLWIDTYQGPPDIITHDAGTNFASAEFRAEAKIMGVTCKQVPTEAHWSVGKTERYHAPLRRAWDILHDELQDDMSDEAILQMAVKAVNDTAGPDGLVPTLLVFGAYPRMTTESPPAPSMVRRSEAIQKATKALRKLTAERQVADEHPQWTSHCRHARAPTPE
ncbi:hypothetical protein P3342_001657 [Pyrenophora teres f. teres]|nr:hypothetical protein P3342_001657 [Pyrenophora teres f. teres]